MEPRTTQEILLTEIRDNVADLEVNLGDVDVNLEALEVINTAIKTAVETIDNAISGSEMQVTNAIERANDLLKFGNAGCVMVSGNAAQSVSTGVYFAVQFLKACTPTTLTIGSSTTVTGQEIPAGTIIYGDVTAITGDSSAFYVLYKGNPQ